MHVSSRMSRTAERRSRCRPTVRCGAAVVRRLDAWMVADEAALVGVIGQVLERAGLSWPSRDLARVVDGCGLDRDADALRPLGPEGRRSIQSELQTLPRRPAEMQRRPGRTFRRWTAVRRQVAGALRAATGAHDP